MTSKKGFSRRAFLKGTGAALAGTAFGVSGHFKTQGIFAPNVVRAQDQVVLAVQEFAHPALEEILPKFEEETGLKVVLEGGPASGIDMQARLSTAYAAGNSPYDVVSDADESAPGFMRAGWLEPLDDVIPEETWADFPESMNETIEVWHSFDGTRYRFPHEFAIGYFFTRNDWLTERDLPVPTTWEEMVEVGKEIADPANDIWATTDGLAKPGLLYVYLAYLATQAGGDIFAFDEPTATAFQFLYDMIHTHQIFPETALNQDYNAQNELYMADRVAFMRQWPFFQGVAEGNTDWFAPEKVKIELPPAGPAGSKSWVGGWGWTIPVAAPNKEGAKELIKFITSPENAPILARGQSWFVMPRKSILEAMADEGNPLLEAMGVYSEAGVPAPRPFHPRIVEAQTLVEDLASLYLTDQASLADVMRQGQRLIQDLEV